MKTFLLLIVFSFLFQLNIHAESCAESIPCEIIEYCEDESENPAIVARALWRMASSVFSGWVSNYTYEYLIKPQLKKTIPQYADKVSKHRLYNSKTYNHLANHWDGCYGGDYAREHIENCTVCCNAFDYITCSAGYCCD